MENKKTTTKKASPKPKVEKATLPKVKKAPNLEAPLYSQAGASKGTIALPKSVYGVKWNADLVHQVVVAMMANKRAGTAHSKDRSEVRGGGRKPWKQKGTGRARHGSSRSPIWSGGGVTFGPRNEKDYSQKINKKMRVKALMSVLSRKLELGQILFVDTISLSAIKTKDAAGIIAGFSKLNGFTRLTSKNHTAAVLVMPEVTEIVTKSFANLPGITTMKASELNTLNLMNFRHVIVVNPTEVNEALVAKLGQKDEPKSKKSSK